MAMAWVTRAVNATEHAFTIMQNDPTWHPVVNGRQYGPDEPIDVNRMVKKGEPITIPPLPPWLPNGLTYPAPNDVITDLSVRYCVVPWQGFGRLRLTGPSGKWIDYEVGRFVSGDKDHLRGVLSPG